MTWAWSSSRTTGRETKIFAVSSDSWGAKGIRDYERQSREVSTRHVRQVCTSSRKAGRDTKEFGLTSESWGAKGISGDN